MCGFDNDWACPNHKTENGKPERCPAGGCRMGCCARDKQADLERLTGQPVPLEAVHQD
jgi:hypothetical protein